MRTSKEGILFLCRHEALCLEAYQDGRHLSIGFGHNSPTLKPGDKITPKMAFELLRTDLVPREDHISELIKVPLTQSQFDALLSLHYQSGHRYLPWIAKEINQLSWVTAANLFPQFDHNAAGVQMPGLHKRRLHEQKLFKDGDYGEGPIPFWRGNPHTTKREEYHVQPGDL